MPHIPRGFAHTGPVPPEFVHQGRSLKRQRAPEPEVAEQRKQFGIATLSPHAFDVDPKDVIRHLFGKDAKEDEHTGQLVVPGR